MYPPPKTIQKAVYIHSFLDVKALNENLLDGWNVVMTSRKTGSDAFILVILEKSLTKYETD